MFHQQKRHAEAESHFREAVRIKPDFAKAHGALGAALYGAAGKSPLGNPVLENKLNEAVACYRKAIELDSNLAMPHFNLGLVYTYRRNDLDNAVACYRKAIELDPESAAAHGGLGEVLYHQGEWEEAASACRKAIELRPQETDHWWWLGWAQYQRGDWIASIESLEKSCQLQDEGEGDAGRWIVMALAHWNLAEDEALAQEDRARHREEAQRLYVQAGSQLDHWSEIRTWPYTHREMRDIWRFRAEARKMGLTSFRLGLWPEAVHDFGLAQDSIEYERFLSLLMAGDESGYRELSREAVVRLADSDNPKDLIKLTSLYALAPQDALAPDRLATIARKGLLADIRTSASRKFFAGLALYRAKQDAEAERLMREGSEENPPWNVPLAGLALVYHRLGEDEKARAHWTKAKEARQAQIETLLAQPLGDVEIPYPRGYAQLAILTQEARAVFDVEGRAESIATEPWELLRRGKVLLALGKREQGLAELQAAVAESENDPAICQWREQILNSSEPDKQE
jgi:tetratricopeptide (TPR) repeat protein